MKFSYVLFAIVIVAVCARNVREKRQANTLLLPDGIEFILNAPLVSKFRCEAAGYYADIDNNCQLFHICDASTNPRGVAEIRQYTFACGNQTIFNQLTLTCSTPEESIPCEIAPQFYAINSKLGLEKTPLHTEEDLTNAAQYIPSRAKLAN
ncbi:U-scoloptoxin(01)-Er1a-like [Panonychus citri]|uniref:U-scoloptoxin(01)-Er1a-like n=1 Tax=Panonychus citri TaxID=50023 RepID=UPI00230786AC|nr:U-scoloptoxin(01)-Er1a-like [Panonychus citri]